MGYYFKQGGQKSLPVNVFEEKWEGTVGDGLLILGRGYFAGRENSKCMFPGLSLLFGGQQGSQLE